MIKGMNKIFVYWSATKAWRNKDLHNERDDEFHGVAQNPHITHHHKLQRGTTGRKCQAFACVAVQLPCVAHKAVDLLNLKFSFKSIIQNNYSENYEIIIKF